MFGPKLDPRAYTTLLLIVIATLLSLNLFAQYTAGNDQSGSQYSDAQSTRALADATRDVAAANREIASALKDVAAAVSKLELKVNVDSGSGAKAPAAAPAAASSAPAPSSSESTPAGEEEVPYEGTFELN